MNSDENERVVSKVTQNSKFDYNSESESVTARLKFIIEKQANLIEQLTLELRKQLSLILIPVHDLRNRDEIILPKSVRQYIDNSVLQTQNLNNILNLTNNLFKLQSGNSSFNIQQVDFGKLVKKIQSSISNKLNEIEIGLILKVPANALQLYLDEDKIAGSINTVLIFAAKSCRPGTKLSVTIDIKKRKFGTSLIDHAIIEITGNGLSIPTDTRARLFNAFQSISLPDGTSVNSLAIPNYIFNLHGGDITLNHNTTKATIISGKLPIGNAHFSDNELTKPIEKDDPEYEISDINPGKIIFQEIKTGTASSKPTVLIVDDEPEILMLLKTILQRNYNIIEATEGHAALKLVREHIPDLIICDIMMPILDGISFTKIMKDDREFSAIPIILLTAVTAESERITGLKTRADAYITKPFNSEELKVIIDNLIEKHHRLSLKYASSLESQSPDQIYLKGQDKRFLEQVHKSIILQLSNPDFSAADLAKSVFLSRRQFERKLKELTTQTPNNFITEIRLSTARELLLNQATSTVSETATAVGFRNAAYFSRLFIKKYGKSPSAISVK